MARSELTLVKQRKLADLIPPPKGGGVLESSGIAVSKGMYYVVFDNVRQVARIDPSLSPAAKGHGWFGRRREGEGYEDIAYSPGRKRFYLLIEAQKHPDGTYKGIIEECDANGRFCGRHWIDFPFEKANTGFEGLAVVRWKGADHLLALCEGNKCRAGRAGRKAGGGRIQVLLQKDDLWTPIATIKLPKSVKFEDYSAVSLRGNRIAVISQETSRLWIGRIRRAAWTIAGRGRIYDFPRTKNGRPRYCTLEGIAWLSDRLFVLVSDLSKPGYRGGCDKTDQSIHVFALPDRRTRRV